MTTCLSVLTACLGVLTTRPVEAGPGGCEPTTSWGLDRIDQRATTGDNQFCPAECGDGTGVTIYVVGTGVDITHPDFGGRAVWGATFTDPAVTTDDNGAGTMEASLAAGATYGVARNATIVAVKVLDEFGSGSVPSVVNGLEWIEAVHTPPSVVLLPFGSYTCSAAFANAINNLYNSGVNVVMAAGNEASDLCDPSCLPAEAIVVGATDDTDTRASFSNHGSCVDLFAPGVDVTGAWPGGGTNTLSGTDFSASYVAGIAALHLSADPTLFLVQDILLAQATLIGDCGSSNNMRLVYADPQVCFGIGPSCPTCDGVTQGFNEALTTGIVGPLSGDDWYWQITSPDFDDTPVVSVDGVTPGDATDDVYPDGAPDGVWNEFDAAQRWAESINGYFASQGCDTTPVTGSVWASVRNQGGTAYLSVSSECAFTLLVSDPSNPTPNCDVGAFFTPCSFNPMAEAFAGSGTDCNRNGSDDFFDTTYGLSADTNFNAIPDECEGIVYETAPMGIPMAALGQAMITPNGNGMTVHNISASGEDGFVSDTGRIDRIDYQFGAQTGIAIGSSATMIARDADGGTIGSTEFVRTSDGIDMITDYTSIGASSVEYQVYDDGQLVHVETAPALSYSTARAGPQNDTTDTVPIPPPLIEKIYYTIDMGEFLPIEMCVPAHSGTSNRVYTLPSGRTVCGDAILTSADVPAGVWGVDRVDYNVSGMDSFVVERVSIGVHGNDHGVRCCETIGTTLRGGSNPLAPDEPALIVSHVNATAEVTPPLNWWTRPYDPAPALFVDTMPISLAGTGRSITLRSQGSLGGVPNTDLGVASLVSTGTNSADIFADFSSLGSPTTMVAVYNKGALVGQTVVPSGLVGTITGYDGVLQCDRFGKLPGTTPCFLMNAPGTFLYETIAGFLGGGPGFVGDEIRIIANEPSSPVDHIESLEISTEGIESVIVIGESSEVEPICPADFDDSGDVGFSDLATILALWGPCPSDCPADLDGSGDVGFGDLVDLLATWGPCSTG